VARSVKDEIKLFTGNSNRGLAEAISGHVGVPLGGAEIGRFSDGEVQVEITENVRGGDVFVIQSICTPTNDNLMELLLMLDAFKRASAKRITAVIPYYGYARQDRKVSPRTPITAKLVADLLTAAGVTRVVAIDLHAGQIQGFFGMPFDHLYANRVVLDYLQPKFRETHPVLVSPDAGGVERARAYAKRLNADLAIIDKRRERDVANISEVMHIIGEVKGRDCIILDDMIDTAGTLCNAAKALANEGARRVFAAATHGVLSGDAVQRIKGSVLEEVVITDTIPLRPGAAETGKFKVLSVASLLGEAITRIHKGDSVTSLFD
jgi:ribose-phosphate pyrophosphokinase